MGDQPLIPNWMAGLEPEDWQFIRRFLLASGSLKEVAAHYQVSYPTLRLRLNRLIEKIHISEDERQRSPFHRRLRLLVAEGRIDMATARTLIEAYEAGTKGENNETV